MVHYTLFAVAKLVFFLIGFGKKAKKIGERYRLIRSLNQPPMSFLRRHVREGESMGGGTKKEEPYCDGIRKHRFLALAQPNAGMTCFLKPVTTEQRHVSASHVIPAWASALEGIYGRRTKEGRTVL